MVAITAFFGGSLMRKILLVALAAVTVAGAGGSKTTAQTTVLRCRAASDTSELILAKLQSWSTATTGPSYENKQTISLPSVSASEIQLVSDEGVCAQAADAYDSEIVRSQAKPPRTRAVYVFRVGPSHYVAIDPESRVGEWWTGMLFTSSFSLVSTWAM
jgi:hypothetical protein